MIIQLLVLGFVLSLDNFRWRSYSGRFRSVLRRAVQVALTFGFVGWGDALAGLLLVVMSVRDRPGHRVCGVDRAGRLWFVPSHQGAAEPEPDELDHPWALVRNTLSLSLEICRRREPRLARIFSLGVGHGLRRRHSANVVGGIAARAIRRTLIRIPLRFVEAVSRSSVRRSCCRWCLVASEVDL